MLVDHALSPQDVHTVKGPHILHGDVDRVGILGVHPADLKLTSGPQFDFQCKDSIEAVLWPMH